MKVADAITAQVVTATPQTSITEVAKTMARIENGAVPVVVDGRVVGLVTDRDIVLRGALGRLHQVGRGRVAQIGDVERTSTTTVPDRRLGNRCAVVG